jgi:hypothetical protein
VDQQKSESASAEKSDEPAPAGKKETKTKKMRQNLSPVG